MLAFFSQRVKIKNIQIASFVFSGLLMLSFAVFSFADSQNNTARNIFEDADQDGLSNDEEKLYGTDSNKADTDGDGYSDSTEIKGGYDPLKMAPGDKINPVTVLDESADSNDATPSDTPKKTNLTEEVSKQVAQTLKESAASQQELSLDDLRNTVQKTISDNIATDTLPEIDVKSIKIHKQKYSDLTEEERAAKIKEDNLNYATAVSYILVNNSPISMQSDDDMQKLTSFAINNSMSVFSGSNPELLDEFSQKGVLITEQLQNVSVPESMLSIHVKALRFAQYAATLKDTMKTGDAKDPLAQISSLAKVQGFIGLFSAFANDIQGALGSVVDDK